MSECTPIFRSLWERTSTLTVMVCMGAMPWAPVNPVDAQEVTLEEIVVTARKRTESVQDIPESITVFSESRIEDSGITRIKDIADLTPNLVVRQSYRLGVVNLSARGLATPQQGDSPLVVNFDGVQAPAQDFINQDLFDIERIEVLKGPQGALYGAGAIGGAINVVTKRPTNEVDAFTKLSLGNENARRLAAGVSGPIAADRVFYRLAGVVQSRDGYITNSLTGDLLDFLDETVLRGGLFITLDQLNIDLRAAVTDTAAGASFYEAMPLLPDPVPEIDDLFGGPLGRLGSDISYGTFENHSNIQTEEERDITTASFRVEYELDGGGTFTSISGYNNSRQYDYGDLDFQPADVLHQDVRFDVDVFNQEFRFASDPNQRFRWVGGVFYQDREIFNQVLVVLGDFSVGHRSIEESQAQPENLVITDTRDVIESQALGVFLSTNYDITDRLELTASARWDHVDVDTRFVGEDPNLISLPDASAARQFDEFQPKFNLAYLVSDNATIYVDLARGFRTGVPNPTSAFAGGLPRFIEPEVADTLELGVKSTFWNDRASLNAAVFSSGVENRHHYFYGAALQSMTTYDEAQIAGLEVDFEGFLTDHLRFSASLGVMNAEIASDEITRYRDFTTGEVALVVNNKGNTLPDTPETSYNLALTYDRPVFGNTTALYQWVTRLQADSSSTVCWLSVTEEDNDPYRFVYRLQCALEEGRKRSGRSGAAANRSFHTTSLRADMDELVRRLSAIQGRLVMVVDDYHLAESAANNRILNDAVNALDDNVTVVVSSRRKPELALPYFRCQGLLETVDADVLKFSEEESNALFADGDHAGAAEAVCRQAAGWPMALQLAKLWLRDADVNARASWELDPRASGITDYLSGEVLKQLPGEVAGMMAETSILTQVNGDIANHITQRSDCWSLISALGTLDALIVPVGKRGGWFRYHQLIREFLRAQLDRRGDEHIVKLQLRASDWFEKHGDLESAVAHAAEAGDTARAVTIIESAGAVRIGLMEGMPALRRVLCHLSTDDIYAHPRLHLAQIWLLAKQGEIGVARQQYDECTRAKSDGDKRGWTDYSDAHKESLFVGLMLVEVYEDKDFNLADIQRIEAMARDVSVVDHWFQGWVNNLLCVMHTRKGNLQAAATVNEAATFHYRQVGSDYGQVWMLLHLAVISHLDGRLMDASRAIARAVKRASVEFANDSGLVAIVRVIESALLLERNRMSHASEQIFDALTATENAEGWVEIYVQGYRTAIELAYFLDGPEEALRHIKRAQQIALDRDLPRLSRAVLLFHIEILTLDGQLDAARKLVEQHALEVANVPGMGDDGWRARVRQAVVLSRLALYRGEGAALSKTLSGYVADARRQGRRRAAMELGAILALVEFSENRREACVDSLSGALQTAVEEGFRRVFVREGRPMARMLEVMIRHVGVSSMDKKTVGFLAELVTALRHPSGDSPAEQEKNILSEKELAVLRLSADGNCNKLIARNLDVSVATVKFHLSNVYRKLGVGNRTVAVAVARENNLL